MKLNNKVPNHMKAWGKYMFCKEDIRYFLLQHTFYSVEEHYIMC
jgi:hypothetical protein